MVREVRANIGVLDRQSSTTSAGACARIARPKEVEKAGNVVPTRIVAFMIRWVATLAT